MLQCNRIDASEGVAVNKTSESKECMLGHYWYFKDVGYEFNHLFVMVVMLCQ